MKKKESRNSFSKKKHHPGGGKAISQKRERSQSEGWEGNHHTGLLLKKTRGANVVKRGVPEITLPVRVKGRRGLNKIIH